MDLLYQGPHVLDRVVEELPLRRVHLDLEHLLDTAGADDVEHHDVAEFAIRGLLGEYAAARTGVLGAEYLTGAVGKAIVSGYGRGMELEADHLGAVYMATDMVTSPTTHRGCWIFGFGIGFLVVVIRIWGGLAEGVMYAILLMNALVPFINRATRPKVFGSRTEVAAS